jgi:hypothetical protein
MKKKMLKNMQFDDFWENRHLPTAAYFKICISIEYCIVLYCINIKIFEK